MNPIAKKQDVTPLSRDPIISEKATAVSDPYFKPKVAELEAYRDRVLADMRAKYRKIHKDFRVYAEDALTRFQANLDELVARLAEQPGATASA